jgi:hypothetical protein
MATKSVLAALALAAVSTVSAQAANITWWNDPNGYAVVDIAGELVPGDTDKFIKIASDAGIQSTAPIMVTLNSPGGVPQVGITIGNLIHRYHFVTSVRPSEKCASACALIWLAGTPRTLSSTSKVGFHAVYYQDSGQISPSGNAEVGAYLYGLGFSYAAIDYFTQTPPESMDWLTPTKAKELNLQVVVLENRGYVAPPTRVAGVVTPPAATGLLCFPGSAFVQPNPNDNSIEAQAIRLFPAASQAEQRCNWILQHQRQY